ncbi:coagulation factor VIII [Chanos chanos]|uniref:Coagulation factor VIII n=1 Tax=Chanos chanos TaxID=29144 RepID=A0A6J2UTB8_CHACN|nr:coagulation factor VIII-like [Chanos chanos]
MSQCVPVMNTLTFLLFLHGMLKVTWAIQKTQEIFIAAEETKWDYIYTDSTDPASNQRRYASGVQKYIKAVYKEYTDSTFTAEKPKSPWAGIQGPTIRATINDRVIVHFKNFASQPFSISPVGIPYWKQSEGAGYDDSTSSKEKEDDAVPPGGYYKYVWDIHPSSVPTISDPECLTYSYSSQVDVVRDINSGLIGALLICKPEALTEDRKRRVPEFVLFFAVFDEAKSWYKEVGIPGDKFRKAVPTPQQYHTINGYINSTLPGLKMCQNTWEVSWHLIGLGSTPDIHSIQFQDHTLKVMDHRKITVEITPMTFTTAQMKPFSAGNFLISCRIHSHQQAGMSAFFTVEYCPESVDKKDRRRPDPSVVEDEYDDITLNDLVSIVLQPRGPPSVLRSGVKGTPKVWVHYIAAEEITWDYAPKTNDWSPQYLGKQYKKVAFVEYTDKTFTVKKTTANRLIGPVLRGEVQDQFQIFFKNLASRPFNIYPNGLTSVRTLKKGTKDKEGKTVDLSTLAVPPGETMEYLWKLTPDDGPTDSDPRCLTWLYQSTVNPERDVASGLVGPLIICKAESLDKTGRVVISDKEKHLIFATFDENKSWYIDENIQKYSKDPSKVDLNDPAFYNSNIMYSVNGFMRNNLEFQMCAGDVTFWHVANIGMQNDFLSVYFTGNTFEKDKVYNTVLTLFPMTGETVSMEMEIAGEWEISAFDPNLKKRGMSVRYFVKKCDELPLKDEEYDDEYFEDLFSIPPNFLIPRGTKGQNKTIVIQVCRERPRNITAADTHLGQNNTNYTTNGERSSKLKDCETKFISVSTDEDKRVLSQGGIPQDILDELDREMDRINPKRQIRSISVESIPEVGTYNYDSLSSQTEPEISSEMEFPSGSDVSTTPNQLGQGETRQKQKLAEDSEMITMMMRRKRIMKDQELDLDEDKSKKPKERTSNDPFKKFLQRMSTNASLEPIQHLNHPRDELETSREDSPDWQDRNRREALGISKDDQDHTKAMNPLAENEVLKDSALDLDGMEHDMDLLAHANKDLIKLSEDAETLNLSSNMTNKKSVTRIALNLEYDDYSDENDTSTGFLYEDTFDMRASEPKFRSYYIAAEEILWDYGITKPPQFIKLREMKRGMRKYFPAYKKVVYRAYQDKDFQQPVKRGELDEHLGIMGPVLKAEVNDILTVVFKNMASRPYSLHLHGVYDKTQGQSGNLGDSFKVGEAPGQPVPPGHKRVYTWTISKRQGPSSKEFDCKAGAYYSDLNMEKDINSGLIGPLLICRPGTLHRRHLIQPNVQDLFLLFTVFDERKSWYMEDNIRTFCSPPCQAKVDDPWFEISNKFAAINGYVAETLPGLIVAQYERARWHLLNVGAGGEFHSVHFHGLPISTGKDEEHHLGVFNLFPGVFGTVEMRPTIAGTWMVECTIGENQLSGMRAKVLVYNPRCNQPLGLQSGRIADDQITASDHYDDWEPRLARLELSGSVNAWIGKSKQSWIQVDLLRPMLVHGVHTQGAKTSLGLSESFTVLYTLSYSLDNEKWKTYRGNNTKPNYIFSGNMDGSRIKQNYLSPPVVGRYIRITPVTFSKQPALRLELLGCDINSCGMPLGMERRLIPNKRISASSFLKTWLLSWSPDLARLNQEGRANAWRPKTNNPHEWIQVDFLSIKRVTGVLTQGARAMLTHMMVTEFTVSVSDNGHTWSSVTEEGKQTEKMFEGNSEYDREKLNRFDPPLFARFIRIHPKGWMNDIALRVEFLGCDTQQRL